MGVPTNRWAGAQRGLLLCLVLAGLVAAPPCRAGAPPQQGTGQHQHKKDPERQQKNGEQKFNATAYTAGHETASGDAPKPGVVEADPKVLPLGSRVRVDDGGELSGEYVVKDKGRKVKGHKLDVYVHGNKHAKNIGKKPVHVDVLQYGDGSRESARSEPLPPPQERAPAAR
jgi:3D (Asp-Asp-Asp) domain-containing protein